MRLCGKVDPECERRVSQKFRRNLIGLSPFAPKGSRLTDVKKPDRDMIKISVLLAEARSIASKRDWRAIETALDHAQTGLLQVEPHNGEREGNVSFRPSQFGHRDY
jgi:hypothetical protein